MANSILNPDAEVTLSVGTVTVKELAWRKALTFFDMLEAQVKGMLDDKGGFKFDAATIFAAVKGNAPLVEWIAVNCTVLRSEATDGERAREEWLESLTLGDMAKIVTKALEINLRSVADEIKNVKGRLDALAVAGTALNSKSNPIPLPTANS